jgi:16S rRNA (cytosine1402-N4)-methyltransferase
MARAFRHQPVLVRECLELLGVSAGAAILDGTLGGGGHAEAILEASAPDGRLLGLDVDEGALAAAGERLRRFGDRVTLKRASFREIDHVRRSLGWPLLDGVLLDLGLSSAQLDAPERGFRFSSTEGEVPLDMRLDPSSPRSARELLASAREEELERWFREYGELRGARRLARAIGRERRRAPLVTAADLVRVVLESGVGRGRRHHPATLVFQALRIAVNDEIRALDEGLDSAVASLGPAGRVAVIAYHSLEDRLVKRRLREDPRLRALTRKPVRPSPEEVRANARARSAKLRAGERVAEAA